MVAFFERLKGRHQVVTTSNAGCDDSLSDTGSNGAFDDGGDGIHRTDDFRLELRRDMEFDLLEEILGSAKATNNEDIL